MYVDVFIVCEFERFTDPPASLPPGALANPFGGPGWWVDGDMAHAVEWLGADETLGAGARQVQLGFVYEVRRLVRGSKLFVAQAVAGADGDLDLRIIAVFQVAGLLVSGDDVEWHERLLRRVQAACQEKWEWLPVVMAGDTLSRTPVQVGGGAML